MPCPTENLLGPPCCPQCDLQGAPGSESCLPPQPEPLMPPPRVQPHFLFAITRQPTPCLPAFAQSLLGKQPSLISPPAGHPSAFASPGSHTCTQVKCLRPVPTTYGSPGASSASYPLLSLSLWTPSSERAETAYLSLYAQQLTQHLAPFKCQFVEETQVLQIT